MKQTSRRRPAGPAAPVALTVAGSDSGGGAGIQADLKTFEALGVFGTSAVTCVTAQNPNAVTGIVALDPEFVARQIETVCAAFPVRAAKTGMLYSAEIIEATARALRRTREMALVVDPVLVAASGARLLREDAVENLIRRLIPHASIVTPNIPEGELLWGRPIPDPAAARAAARELCDRLGTPILLKGGHLGAGFFVEDWLALPGGRLEIIRHRRRAAAETHGAGCTLSAALAALLARGWELVAAARGACDFVARALAAAQPAGRHRPLNFRAAGRALR